MNTQSTPVFLLAGLGALCATGCRSTTVSYPFCPAPVYLSKVDHVGDPGSPSRETERLGALESRILSSTSTVDDDTVEVETTPGELTADLLRRLPVGDDVHRGELKLQSVHMSASAWLHVGTGQRATGWTHGTVAVVK